MTADDSANPSSGLSPPASLDAPSLDAPSLADAADPPANTGIQTIVPLQAETSAAASHDELRESLIVPAAPEAAVEQPQTPQGDSPRSALRTLLSRAAWVFATTTILLAALLAGLRLRVWAWEVTQIIPPDNQAAATPQRPAGPRGGGGGGGGRFAGRQRPGGPGYGRMGGLRSGDVVNGHTWGSKIYNAAAADQTVDWRGHRDPTSWGKFFKAYLAYYDQIEETSEEGKYQLDYAPGRLLAMALWVRHAHVAYPHIETWQPAYAYTAPVLRFNTCCELLAAIASFFLVEHWVRRGKTPPPHSSRRRRTTESPATLALEPTPRRVPAFGADGNALLLGLLAALLLWFNPATLVDGHVWPQWDVWLMPFYLWALYLGSVRAWFPAGALLGVGIMFKGQLLFGVPILLLWPLFGGNFAASWRCLFGFLSAVALVACGWLVNGHIAWIWIATLVATCVALALAARTRKWVFAIATLVCFAILCWPWLRHDRPKPMQLVIPLSVTLLTASAAAWQLRRNRQELKPSAADTPTPRRRTELRSLLDRQRIGRWIVALSCLFAAGVFGAAWIFHGSMGWFDLGFGYGTYKHLKMSNNSSNLPAILNTAPYNWNLQDVVFTVNAHWAHVHWPVPMRTLLGLFFFTSLIFCCIAAAIKARRNDPTILITFITPWVLLFTVMPQMHQRYFMWAAAFSATLVGLSLRMTLMHLLISALATIMIVRQLLEGQRTFAPDLAQMLSGIHPAIGWMVAVIALVFVYGALMPRTVCSSQFPKAAPTSPAVA